MQRQKSQKHESEKQVSSCYLSRFHAFVLSRYSIVSITVVDTLDSLLKKCDNFTTFLLCNIAHIRIILN